MLAIARGRFCSRVNSATQTIGCRACSFIPKMCQETPSKNDRHNARVSFFLNRFRELGFIDYDGGSGLQVHSAVLNIILEDQNPVSPKKKEAYSLTHTSSVRGRSATEAPSFVSGHKYAVALEEYRMAGFASVEGPQHVGHEEDQQYSSQSYARTAAITPAAVAVVAPTAS